MFILAEAWASLKRNQSAVFTYVLVSMVLVAVGSGLDTYLGGVVEEGDSPAWLKAYMTLKFIVLAVAGALLQALVFARLASELDKPLWKHGDSGAALRRFFMPWLIINLFGYATVRLLLRAGEAQSEPAVTSVMLVLMLYYALSVPFGACIMFHGELKWRELGRILDPMSRQFRLAALAFLPGLLVFMADSSLAFSGLYERVMPALGPALIQVPFSVLDLLAFTAMFLVCRIDRDAEYDDDENSFDL